MSQVRSAFHKFCAGHGAGIALSCTRATTHLVTTESEADNPTRKVLEAMKRGTPVVNEDFVHACVAAGRPVSHAAYLLMDGDESGGGSGGGGGNGGSGGSNGAGVGVAADDDEDWNDEDGGGFDGLGLRGHLGGPPKAAAANPRTSAAASAASQRAVVAARLVPGGGTVVALHPNAASSAAAKAVMLAEKYVQGRLKDPTGWWISEKLDGVRAYWDGRDFYRWGAVFVCVRASVVYVVYR